MQSVISHEINTLYITVQSMVVSLFITFLYSVGSIFAFRIASIILVMDSKRFLEIIVRPLDPWCYPSDNTSRLDANIGFESQFLSHQKCFQNDWNLLPVETTLAQKINHYATWTNLPLLILITLYVILLKGDIRGLFNYRHKLKNISWRNNYAGCGISANFH